MMPNINMRNQFDATACIKNILTRQCVVVGESACVANGLTSAILEVIQLSSLDADIVHFRNFVCAWYYSPFADRTDHTRPDSNSPMVLIPTAERSLWEYIILKDNFDEGVLVESIKDYLWQHNDDESKLLEEARYWGCGEEEVKYWVNEARNDYEV